MHTSVTAMATDIAVTALSVATTNVHRCHTNENIAVTVLSNDIVVSLHR